MVSGRLASRFLQVVVSTASWLAAADAPVKFCGIRQNVLKQCRRECMHHFFHKSSRVTHFVHSSAVEQMIRKDVRANANETSAANEKAGPFQNGQ